MDMYAKTQKVDARMGNSRDWNTDVPNIKLSRAFVVVLILHVVAVGGILAFEMFKTEPSGIPNPPSNYTPSPAPSL